MSFSLPVRVYYEDTDAGGVVYYANYLRFMERARTEWLRSLGFDNSKLMEEQGLCFVVAHVDIGYKRPARLDDALEIGCTIEERSPTRLKIRQSVTRGGDMVADGVVTLAMLDLKTGRGTKIPLAIQDCIL